MAGPPGEGPRVRGPPPGRWLVGLGAGGCRPLFKTASCSAEALPGPQWSGWHYHLHTLLEGVCPQAPPALPGAVARVTDGNASLEQRGKLPSRGGLPVPMSHSGQEFWVVVCQGEQGWHTGTGFLPEATWGKRPTGLCNSSSAPSWPGAISLTVRWQSVGTEEVPSTHAATCRAPVCVPSWGHTASKPGLNLGS